jgi:hypothetical protein
MILETAWTISAGRVPRKSQAAGKGLVAPTRHPRPPRARAVKQEPNLLKETISLLMNWRSAAFRAEVGANFGLSAKMTIDWSF